MDELKGSGWLSTDEVAKVLDVSAVTVGRIIAKGELIAHRFGGQWRISPYDLREYIASVRNEPKKKPLILHGDIDQTMQILRNLDYSKDDAMDTAQAVVAMAQPFRLYATVFDEAMRARFIEVLGSCHEPDWAGWQVVREALDRKDKADET